MHLKGRFLYFIQIFHTFNEKAFPVTENTSLLKMGVLVPNR